MTTFGKVAEACAKDGRNTCLNLEPKHDKTKTDDSDPLTEIGTTRVIPSEGTSEQMTATEADGENFRLPDRKVRFEIIEMNTNEQERLRGTDSDNETPDN